jgi:uncharacterized membrane protein (Fun14 family)
MGDKSLPAGPASSAGGSGQVFYRFTNPEGRLVITDTPPGGPAPTGGPAEVVVLEPPPPKSIVSGLEMRSLWIGVGLGIAGGFLLSWVLRIVPRMVARFVIGAAILVVAGLAYLGWMRRSTGLSQDLAATPQALVEDAKQAVEKMNARMREQDEQLKKLENESKK